MSENNNSKSIIKFSKLINDRNNFSNQIKDDYYKDNFLYNPNYIIDNKINFKISSDESLNNNNSSESNNENLSKLAKKNSSNDKGTSSDEINSGKIDNNNKKILSRSKAKEKKNFRDLIISSHAIEIINNNINTSFIKNQKILYNKVPLKIKDIISINYTSNLSNIKNTCVTSLLNDNNVEESKVANNFPNKYFEKRNINSGNNNFNVNNSKQYLEDNKKKKLCINNKELSNSFTLVKSALRLNNKTNKNNTNFTIGNNNLKNNSSGETEDKSTKLTRSFSWHFYMNKTFRSRIFDSSNSGNNTSSKNDSIKATKESKNDSSENKISGSFSSDKFKEKKLHKEISFINKNFSSLMDNISSSFLASQSSCMLKNVVKDVIKTKIVLTPIEYLRNSKNISLEEENAQKVIRRGNLNFSLINYNDSKIFQPLNNLQNENNNINKDNSSVNKNKSKVNYNVTHNLLIMKKYTYNNDNRKIYIGTNKKHKDKDNPHNIYKYHRYIFLKKSKSVNNENLNCRSYIYNSNSTNNPLKSDATYNRSNRKIDNQLWINAIIRARFQQGLDESIPSDIYSDSKALISSDIYYKKTQLSNSNSYKNKSNDNNNINFKDRNIIPTSIIKCCTKSNKKNCNKLLSIDTKSLSINPVKNNEIHYNNSNNYNTSKIIKNDITISMIKESLANINKNFKRLNTFSNSKTCCSKIIESINKNSTEFREKLTYFNNIVNNKDNNNYSNYFINKLDSVNKIQENKNMTVNNNKYTTNNNIKEDIENSISKDISNINNYFNLSQNNKKSITLNSSINNFSRLNNNVTINHEDTLDIKNKAFFNNNSILYNLLNYNIICIKEYNKFLKDSFNDIVSSVRGSILMINLIPKLSNEVFSTITDRVS